MPKEFNVIDLLSKLSANSFLLQLENERVHLTPGVFLGMPGKFFLYVDILDSVMKNLYVNGKGEVVVSLDDLQKSLNPLDLNQYFTKLESTIQNKDILGINEEKQNPVSDVKVVENKELPQPTTPTIGELEPDNKTQPENEKQITGEIQHSKPNKQHENNYQKNGYIKNYTKRGYNNKTSTTGKTSTSGKTYQKNYNGYNKTYKKTYKKSENK
jgi:hypothetical protein